MQTVTFDQLPDLVSTLINKVDQLQETIKSHTAPAEDEWFGMDQLIEYLPSSLTKSTIYRRVAQKDIPYHKGEGSKNLHFLKSEIDAWLKGDEPKHQDNKSIIPR